MTITEESVRRDPRLPIERVACRVYLSANQSDLANGVWTKVNLNTTDYDLGLNYNVATYRFTVPVSGLYVIHGKVDFDNVIANKTYGVGIYVDGILTTHYYSHTGAGTTEVDAHITDEQYLQKNSYIELYAISNASVDTVDIGGGNHHTILSIRLITKEGIR